jgi:hypothetical protein
MKNHFVCIVGRKTMKVVNGLVILTHEEFEYMQAENEGVCLACGETRDCCEPDAREYTCESCDKPQVYGIEELLIMGKVDFE